MAICRGIDISRYQDRTPTTDPSDDPDWTKVAAAGYTFGLCRMAKAGQARDETGRRELAKMLLAMPVSGAYGVVGISNPAADARFFLDEVAAVVDPQRVLLMLDAENFSDGSHPSLQGVDAYARVIHDAVGRWPIAYCPGWWMAEHGYSAAGLGLANCPWAQSHYYPGPWTDTYLQARKPALAYGFTELAWLQFTSGANVAGFTDPVDVNAYFGTADQLRAQLLGTVPTPEVDDVSQADVLAALKSDEGKKVISDLVYNATARMLRIAVGPDDASVPAGTYFGRVETKVDSVLAGVEAGVPVTFDLGAATPEQVDALASAIAAHLIVKGQELQGSATTTISLTPKAPA